MSASTRHAPLASLLAVVAAALVAMATLSAQSAVKGRAPKTTAPKTTAPKTTTLPEPAAIWVRIGVTSPLKVDLMPWVVQQKIIRPKIQIRPWFRPQTNQPFRSNALLQGEYRTAFDAFDRGCKRLAIPANITADRRLIDELGSLLVEVRRALWQIERNRAWKPVAATPISYHSFGIPTRITIFSNPLGVNLGVGYQTAVDSLTQTRNALKRERDPRAARRIVDQLDRLLLDLRRELWKIEQAKKKKTR